MSYDKQKLLRFQEAILEDADEKIARMNQNVSKYEQRELNNTKQQKLEEIFTYMQNRVRHLKSEFNYKLTKKSLEFKKEILSSRNELIEKVMKQSENEILNFVHSDEYKNYLLNKVKQVFDEFNFSNAKIKIRREDLKFKEDILNCGNISEVLIDDHNKLGGFTAIDPKSNILVDKTIATILDNQRQHLLKTSGLIVNKDWNEVKEFE